MANRVLLDASGLKVSKPGTNVLTAAPAGLQFSSDWSGLGFYSRGEIDCDWNETPPRTFSLGKTFPSIPLVQLQRVISASQVDLVSSLGSFWWGWDGSYQDGSGKTIWHTHDVMVTVTTSHLSIHSSRQGTNPTFKLRYTVMDYNL